MEAFAVFGIAAGAFVLSKGKKKGNIDIDKLLPKKKIQEIKESLSKAVKWKDKDAMDPSVLLVKRTLRGRFNSAIDAFKYGKRTFYEKFLSRDELKEVLKKTEKSIKELIKNGKQYKIIDGKIVSSKTGEPIRAKVSPYVAQLLSDHKHAKQLLKMTIGM